MKAGGQPQKRHTMSLDRASGVAIKDETFDSLGAGRRARRGAVRAPENSTG